ncbi:hypothetical protein HRI_002714000 [Hibiscus trionum]|uniref:Endonuclease/exonuclease/phosphatase domain-containing protein n=1 Tax=Hibiscus trionum TaxID=183268 RepID=A0A9W7I769_HIBTR|nr:hypothetical protein HRI_002714000 [Hibiscus trionum]
MAKVQKKCGYSHGIEVGARGSSSGLCFAWRDDCQITLRPNSIRHIDVLISRDCDGNMWRCTGFYSAHKEQNKSDSWNLLRHLDDTLDILWLVIGDFNELLFSFEKSGGWLQNQRQNG